jgi:hypothetical protein
MIGDDKNINRRTFLKTAGSIAAGLGLSSLPIPVLGQFFRSRPAQQDDKQYDFLLARVRFECDSRVPDLWNVYPGADLNLLTELTSTVRCKVKLPQYCTNETPQYGSDSQFNGVITFDDPEPYRKYPFAFMTGEGGFTFSQNQKDNLKRYLQSGGFLFMDDCVYSNGQGGDFFYQSAYKVLEETFGSGSVVRIPKTHEVFHNVFDFADQGMPYMQGQNYGAHGLFIDNRLAVFLSPSDLHCGWTTPYWFGHEKYKQALQMGINIIMYAMSH